MEVKNLLFVQLVLVILIFIFGSIVFGIFATGVIYKYWTLPSEEYGTEKKPIMYQNLQLNTRTNELSYGISSHYDLHLNEEEYIYRRIEGVGDDDIFELISNVGAEEYICTITCICEDYDEEIRRTEVIGANRYSVTLVVVTVIVSVSALIWSKRRFMRYCEEQMRLNKTCPKLSAESIFDCENLGSKRKESNPYHKWWCVGTCELNDYWFNSLSNSHHSRKVMEKKCELLKIEGHVYTEAEEGGATNAHFQAMEKFSEDSLKPFCANSAIVINPSEIKDKEATSILESEFGSTWYNPIQSPGFCVHDTERRKNVPSTSSRPSNLGCRRFD